MPQCMVLCGIISKPILKKYSATIAAVTYQQLSFSAIKLRNEVWKTIGAFHLETGKVK